MKIAICDDEKYVLNNISAYLKGYEEKNNITFTIVSFKSGEEFLEYYKQDRNIDLIILDIMMCGIDGMKVAHKIREFGSRLKIVFLTSFQKLATKGYAVNASRYWIKPISYEFFSDEMKLLCEEIRLEDKKFFVEKNSESIEKIFFDDLLYIETIKRKSCIHTLKQDISSRTPMKVYEKLLDERFYRCHAAYIVNMSYIHKIEKLKVTLKNGKVLYISKYRKSDFLDAFTLYLGAVVSSF